MKRVWLVLISLTFLLAISCQSKTQQNGPDLILYNGTLWTVNPSMPWAEALAVKGEKIISIGTSEDILKLEGKKTKAIDLEGAFVLPGFIDSHTHFLQGGFSLSSVQLYGAQSKEDFVARIEEKAKSLKEKEWILNGEWDHQKFNPPRLPQKQWIDAVTPDNPVCVNRHDGHMALCNSLALNIAGIDKETVSPPGGEIVIDPETGEPTGILKDAAMELVTEHIPVPTLDEKIAAAEAALKQAAELGLTSIHDMNFEESYKALDRIRQDGDLTARIYGYSPVSDRDSYDSIKQVIPEDSNYLRIGGLKGFVDGSLGSSTGLFFEPYSDNPETSGLMVSDMFPEGIMEERIRQADKDGLQIAVHAIGDRANNIILNIYEKAILKNGARERRWRVEHAQHLLLQDIKRFGDLGIISSVQPYHAIDDGRWAEIKIGADRARTTYAFRSLLDSGAVLACGSDWTVAPLNPLTGIYAAVTRRTLDGKHPEGWYPEQKISLEEAIKGYTLNGAFAEFAEDKKGSLEVEKWADVVVLKENLFKIPAEEIKDIRVQMTIVGGTIVYQDK